MNQYKSLSFASRIYLLTPEAFAAFEVYLKSLQTHFKRYTDSEKKVETVEFEIADKFDAIIASKDHLEKADVEKIISHFGYAEDWDKRFSTRETRNDQSDIPPFFLDKKNALIGGVCAGLSNYFKVNVTLVRALTVVLTILFVPLLFFYLAIWWLAPQSLARKKTQSSSFLMDSSIFKKATQMLSTFFSKFIGIIFLLVALTFIAAITIGVIYFINEQQLDILQIQIFPRDVQGFYVVSLFASVLIPFILIFMLGLRILNNKPFFRFTWTGTTLIWVMSVIYLVYYSQQIRNEFDYVSSFSEVQFLDTSNLDAVRIRTNFSEVDDFYGFLAPDVNLITTNKYDSIRIVTRYTASGASGKGARENARKIIYEPKLRNSTILLENQFTFFEETPYRLQRVEVDMYVPEGLSLEISNFNHDFFYIENKRVRYANRGEWRFNRSLEINQHSFPKFEDNLRIKSTKNGFELETY